MIQNFFNKFKNKKSNLEPTINELMQLNLTASFGPRGIIFEYSPNDTYVNKVNKNLDYLPHVVPRLKKLEILNLSQNKFVEIPKQIFRITTLRELRFSTNQITYLPKEIYKLKNLEVLDLSNNNISNVPIQICKLKNLRLLDLSNNNLTSIPKEIIKLQNLRILDLQNNRLKSLPFRLNTKNFFTKSKDYDYLEKIVYSMLLDKTSYEINNLEMDTEILIFTNLKKDLDNLPCMLKELWLNIELKKDIEDEKIKIKLPFRCIIHYFSIRDSYSYFHNLY